MTLHATATSTGRQALIEENALPYLVRLLNLYASHPSKIPSPSLPVIPNIARLLIMLLRDFYTTQEDIQAAMTCAITLDLPNTIAILWSRTDLDEEVSRYLMRLSLCLLQRRSVAVSSIVTLNPIFGFLCTTVDVEAHTRILPAFAVLSTLDPIPVELILEIQDLLRRLGDENSRASWILAKLLFDNMHYHLAVELIPSLMPLFKSPIDRCEILQLFRQLVTSEECVEAMVNSSAYQVFIDIILHDGHHQAQTSAAFRLATSIRYASQGAFLRIVSLPHFIAAYSKAIVLLLPLLHDFNGSRVVAFGDSLAQIQHSCSASLMPPSNPFLEYLYENYRSRIVDANLQPFHTSAQYFADEFAELNLHR